MRKHCKRFLLISAALIFSLGSTFAQRPAAKSITLAEALKKVTRAFGTEFIYDRQLLQSKSTSYDFDNLKGKSAEEVLKAVLYPNDFLFVYIKDNYYTVVPKDRVGEQPAHPVLQSAPAAQREQTVVNTAQASLRRISGIVVTRKGVPVAGASVTAQLAGTGITSDVNGQFVIAVKQNDLITVSSVGFQSQEISISDQAALKINLETSQKQLDEIVVIGYGTTTQRKSTGSVSSITAEAISKQPVGNPLATLPGRISGTLVAQNNGLPGSAVQLQIRGQGSLSSGTIPLYVIDGVPFTNFNGGSPATDNLNAFGTSGASGGVSPFGMINPADIERIDILKDADATSIYGSRGANGVVLITTKKGRAGKTRLDVSANTGFTELNRTIPVLSLQDYLNLRREAFKNDATAPTATTAPDLLTWDTTKSTDWQKMFLGGTGHIADVQATLSGGDERTRFLFNSAYRRESTVFPGDNADKRFSTRLSVDHNSADRRFNASFAVSYSNANTNLVTSDLTSIYNLPPNLPLYDATGKLFWTTQFTNPLASLLKRYKGITTNLIGNATLRYTIMPGLNLKTTFGYTNTDLDQNTTNPASSQNPVNNPTSSAVFSFNKAQNWIAEPTLEYVTKLSQGKFTALAGASWQHNTSKGQYLTGSNYSSEALLGTLSGAGTIAVNYNNIVEYKYNAFFGSLNYDWKSKYIVNATFRRDGSSRFGPNNRFGNFGAIGAAWVFSDEALMKDISFLSFGKLRGSIGTTGNDQISNYLYLPLYSATTVYLGNPAIVPVTLPNPDIKWETTKKLEFGIDLGFINDKLLVTADYYRNRSSDQITFVSVPLQSGYNSVTSNLPALIQNTGFELEINSTNINVKDFKWTTAFNLTLPKNKLVDFPGLASSFYSTSYIIGQPINFTRVYHYLGVDPATGRATFEDVDKDGAVTFANDRVVAPIGTPYYGGLNNSFSYKNWQFDLFFQFNHRFGTTKILNTRPGALVNQNTSYLDRWRSPGDINSIPGATTTAGSALYNSYNNYTGSDAVWGDASYVKLRSAQLSYSLPQAWISHLKFANCRVFAEGQNLVTWSKNKYIYDTETQVQGGPSGLGTGTIGQVLPPLRTIVFGINCSF